ncbi:MAG TPA: hypothetical protein VFD71_13290, partial [Planctomycetota bacterium]|nr:hypothetical protein [Planctomycetota bacterium]
AGKQPAGARGVGDVGTIHGRKIRKEGYLVKPAARSFPAMLIPSMLFPTMVTAAPCPSEAAGT